MATSSSTLLQPTNSTAALIQAWVGFIDSLLIAGGWVNTGDTGQTAAASMTVPGGANTKVGYRVYRMDDAMQSTSPVYLRIDFGSAAAANTPGMWWTIGTGSSGTGTITNIRYDGGAVAAAPQSLGSSSATASNSYGSAGNNRIHLGMFVTLGTPTRIYAISLERSRDETGEVTADGLVFYYGAAGAGIGAGRYIVLGSITQPPVEGGVQFVLAQASPSAFSGDVGIGLAVPIRGYAQPPATGLAIVCAGDFIAESGFSVTVYGETRTYQHLNSLVPVHAPTLSSPANTRVCIRYD